VSGRQGTARRVYRDSSSSSSEAEEDLNIQHPRVGRGHGKDGGRGKGGGHGCVVFRGYQRGCNTAPSMNTDENNSSDEPAPILQEYKSRNGLEIWNK
jgi:hypothetical protein